MHPRLVLRLGHDMETTTNTFECRWSICHTSLVNYHYPLWQSVDITIQKLTPGTTDRHLPSTTPPFEHGASYEQHDATAGLSVQSLGLDDTGSGFIHALLSSASSAPLGRGRAAKLIIPRRRGYIVRSDIVPLRISGSSNLIKVSSFAAPQQWFSGEAVMETDFSRLPNVFAVAAGGIIIDVHESINDVAADLDAFETEVRNRLSFPWVLEKRRPRQTLLQKPSISTWWFWMPQDAGWRIRSTQICVALSFPGGIDGIVTFHESLQFEVAKAAEILSLPTPPAAALAIAADKYKTSIAAGHPALLGHGKDEALQVVQEHKCNAH
ncbi:hypothetical protein N7530_000443 [Penicillium desertorum]|uniref:Uncharacterized protein n=1 Tax=Penicillium desertorum TaxID=1303715 RepID=A0A9W9X847_9EURO|nr:hypothetical protein N7530_000443 [Penicillium desertorum]